MKRYIKADFDIEESQAFNAREDVRALMARKTSSPELMELYLYDPSSYVRGMLAENKALPVEYFTILSTDTDWWVRKQVASNPRTPPQILDALSNDVYEDVRDMVAMNSSAFGSTLAKFRDGPALHRTSIAGNPSTPQDVLVKLTQDKVPNIRWEAAENINTPLSAVIPLLNDPDREVRKSAQQALKDRGVNI